VSILLSTFIPYFVLSNSPRDGTAGILQKGLASPQTRVPPLVSSGRANEAASEESPLTTFQAPAPSFSVKPGFWYSDWGGSSNEWINGIAIGTDGSIYETGTSGSFSSNGDAVLLKYSADGTLQWTKLWNDGAPGGDVGASVAVSSDGSVVYVVGTSWSSISGPSSGLLIQFASSTGSVNWAEEWSDTSSIAANGVAVSPDGSVYVTGANDSTIAQLFYVDGFLMKFNSLGALSWANLWKGPNQLVWGTAVTTDAGNNAYVTGSVQVGTGSATSLLKFGLMGNLLYQNYFTPNSAYSIGEGLSLTPDGSALYVVGVDYAVQLQPSGGKDCQNPNCATYPVTVSFSSSASASISMVNPIDGSLAWRQEFNIGSFDAATAAAATSSGVLVAGITNGPGVAFGKDSLFVGQVSSSGQMTAQSEWTSSGTTDGWGVAASTDGGLFVGGSVDTAGPYTLSVSGGQGKSVSVATAPALAASSVLTSRSYTLATPAYSLSSNGNTYYSGMTDTILLHFAPPVSVSFAVNPAGAGTVSPSGTWTLFPGDQVPLTATPSGGGFFDYWDSGGAVSIPASQVNSATATATVASTGTVTANFYASLNIGVTPGYCYTLNPSPGGTQQGFCGNNVFEYHAGTQVTVVASSLQTSAAGVQIGLTEAGALVSTDATSSSPPTTITVAMSLPNVDVSLAYLSSVPTMQFIQSGLQAGSQWRVSLMAYRLQGEVWTYAQTQDQSSSISFTGFSASNWAWSIPNVLYNGCTYTPNSPSGNYPVGQASVAITFSVSMCNVTFAESGLPSGTSWSAIFNGVTLSSTSTTITFQNIPPGSYSWSVSTPGAGSNSEYVPSPQAGSLTTPTVTSQAITYALQYQVTFGVSPSGSGSTSPAGSNWYNAGSSVSISESPNSGYVFSGWAASSGLTLSCSTCTSTTLTVGASGAVTANFVIPQCSVSFAVSPSGSGTTSPSGTVTYNCGSAVGISASPTSGYVFSGWAASSGLTVSCSTCVSTSLTVGATGAVTANFYQPVTQYYLTMRVSGNGYVSPGSGYYNSGSTVTITATANPGCYSFYTWTGGGAGSYTGTNNPASVTMNGPITETATIRGGCAPVQGATVDRTNLVSLLSIVVVVGMVRDSISHKARSKRALPD